MNLNNRASAGYTVIEVIVAAGLLGLLALGFSVTSMAFLKNTNQTNLRITRDQIVSQLRVVSTHQKSILKSLSKPENAAFHDCVCGVGKCANMKEPLAPFALYDSGGQLQSPAYYDSAGLPCDPTREQCVIRVRTSFFAQCCPDFTSTTQNPPSSCDGTPAEFVGIMYTVDENPISANLQITHLKPVSGPVYIQSADLPSGACP